MKQGFLLSSFSRLLCVFFFGGEHSGISFPIFHERKTLTRTNSSIWKSTTTEQKAFCTKNIFSVLLQKGAQKRRMKNVGKVFPRKKKNRKSLWGGKRKTCGRTRKVSYTAVTKRAKGKERKLSHWLNSGRVALSICLGDDFLRSIINSPNGAIKSIRESETKRLVVPTDVMAKHETGTSF